MLSGNKRYYLSIDVGTSSLRAALLREDLTIYKLKIKERIAANLMKADEEWFCLAELLKGLVQEEPGLELLSMGISGYYSWLLVDENGNPVSPVFLYTDSREEEREKALNILTEAEFFESAARRLSAEAGILKLLYYKARKPDAYSNIRYLLSIKDYLNYKLTGTISMDYTTACYSMCFNVKERKLDTGVLDRLGIGEEKLPPLKSGSDLLGYTSRDCERITGLKRGIPVAVGSIDGALGIVGAAGKEKSTFTNILGTTDVCFTMTDRLIVDQKNRRLVTNIGPLKGTWLVGGPTGYSGGTVDWFARNFSGGKGLEALTAAAEKVPCGSGGVMANLGLLGERTPYWNASMRGSLAGLNPKTGPQEVFRAMLESDTYLSKNIFDLTSCLGAEIKKIIVTGGGSQNRLWIKIKSAVFGTRVFVPLENQSTLRGAAILAMLCLNQDAEIPDVKMRTCDADPESRDLYQYEYDKYLHFIDAIKVYYSGS